GVRAARLLAVDVDVGLAVVVRLRGDEADAGAGELEGGARARLCAVGLVALDRPGRPVHAGVVAPGAVVDDPRIGVVDHLSLVDQFALAEVQPRGESGGLGGVGVVEAEAQEPGPVAGRRRLLLFGGDPLVAVDAHGTPDVDRRAGPGAHARDMHDGLPRG